MADWVLHADGLCEPNPGGWMCWAWSLSRPDEEPDSAYGSIAAAPGNTINIAEYDGVGFGLKEVARLVSEGYVCEKLVVLSDSQMVVNQLIGKWKCKKPHLAIHLDRCAKLASEIGKVEFRWIPRDENAETDELTRRAYREATGKEPPDRSKGGF